MKSMKAALVGATLIGAALAGAVTVDETGLSGYKFFTNGEPAVKVVVGSKAAPSDGVVAANIAAMLGNLAYTDQSVSITGKDALSCGAGDATGGTCAVSDASKKVTMTVTVPGASPANVYTMRTYINDYLDNQSETTRSATQFAYDGGATVTPAFRLTKDKSSILVLPDSGKVANPRNRNVLQEVNFYLGAKTQYDTTTSYKQVVAQGMRGTYDVTFSEPLPYCWDTSKNNNLCPTSDQLVQTHTYINFLGSKWVVISVSPTTGAITSVELGKETAYSPYMNIDDEISAANGAKVKLRSVSPFGYGQGGTSLPYASFEVTSATGTVTTETLQTGESKDVAGITLKVNKIFPGVNNVNYADVSIYSDKLTLTNNAQIDSTTHQYWYTAITSAADGTNNPSSISNIKVYSNNPMVKTDDKWKAGENMPLIRGAESYYFTYEGLDEAAVTYDTLQFNIGNGSTFFDNEHKWSGAYLDVYSAVSNAFQNGTGVATSNHVRIALTNQTADAGLSTAWAGAAFIPDSTDGFWKPILNTLTAQAVDYHYSASETATIGYVINGSTNLGTLWVKEYDEDNQAGTPKYIYALYDATGASANQFVDAESSTVTTKVDYGTYYWGVGQLGATVVINTSPTYETGFVSNRGTKFTSYGTVGLTLSYPKSVVKGKYTFKAAGTNATSGSIQCASVGVGQTCTIDTGYVATVDSIAALTSGESGEGSCTLAGDSGLAASPASAAVVAPLNTKNAPLVVLDRDASSTEPLIVVGGPMVNTMAEGAGLPSAAGSEAVVTVSGGKIFVAGYTASDTTDAGNKLVEWLADNRATVRA